MKKLLLLCLFMVGLGFALFNFKGLANQGEYESIVLDFREDVPAAQIENQVKAIAQQYNVTPSFNSEFSAVDHVFIVKGDRTLLKALRKSDLAKKTESIEPNYSYKALGVPNDPFYSKQ